MRGMGGAGPRSMLMGGGKLGNDGRGSWTGDRIAGSPPCGNCGLVRRAGPHCCSGAVLGAYSGDIVWDMGLSVALGGLL